MSMYGSNHVSWLNWITLCTFLVLIHGLMPVLKILCEQHFYHTDCIQAYHINWFYFSLLRTVNHYANHENL